MSPQTNKRNHILAFGHENIQAIHPTTLMFTKEKHLSKNWRLHSCRIRRQGVSGFELQTFKEKLRKPNAKLTIIIEADGFNRRNNAFGSPKLILSHATDIVIRKSDYISDRTLAIHADKSSIDLPRALVEKLKNPKQKIKINLKRQRAKRFWRLKQSATQKAQFHECFCHKEMLLLFCPCFSTASVKRSLRFSIVSGERTKP